MKGCCVVDESTGLTPPLRLRPEAPPCYPPGRTLLVCRPQRSRAALQLSKQRVNTRHAYMQPAPMNHLSAKADLPCTAPYAERRTLIAKLNTPE